MCLGGGLQVVALVASVPNVRVAGVASVGLRRGLRLAFMRRFVVIGSIVGVLWLGASWGVASAGPLDCPEEAPDGSTCVVVGESWVWVGPKDDSEPVARCELWVEQPQTGSEVCVDVAWPPV